MVKEAEAVSPPLTRALQGQEQHLNKAVDLLPLGQALLRQPPASSTRGRLTPASAGSTPGTVGWRLTGTSYSRSRGPHRSGISEVRAVADSLPLVRDPRRPGPTALLRSQRLTPASAGPTLFGLVFLGHFASRLLVLAIGMMPYGVVAGFEVRLSSDHVSVARVGVAALRDGSR
jgi:hypothetical protein